MVAKLGSYTFVFSSVVFLSDRLFYLSTSDAENTFIAYVSFIILVASLVFALPILIRSRPTDDHWMFNVGMWTSSAAPLLFIVSLVFLGDTLASFFAVVPLLILLVGFNLMILARLLISE